MQSSFRRIAVVTATVVAAPVIATLASAGPAGAAAGSTVLINAGGSSLVVGHTRWSADQYAVGGHRLSVRSAIEGTTADGFFRTARAGMSGYRIPVGRSGSFQVTLKFAELERRFTGQRVFSVTAEGSTMLSRVDIAGTAGRNRAISATRTVSVRDGVLNLGFVARRGQPLVSGIAVRPVALPAARTVSVPNRSGLAWASGVYDPSGSPSGYAGFGSWRGSPIDVATMWTARQSWSDLIDPSWLYRTWTGTPVTKVVGVAPIPEGVGSATLARCADGAYDDKWADFGANIKAAGMDGETIIRLGWEFNGDWYKWSADKPSDFAGCWRHIVSSARKVAPKLKWDWTVNAGAGQSVRDARDAWPGNDYVDIVGIDSYDIWPAVTSESSWNVHLKGDYGLNFWRDFAVAHHKPLSVPEWGIYPGTSHAGHNGGDNPYYINKMHDFFAANASVIAYESYFNESASYYAGSLHGPVQNPKASAAYRAAF